MSLYFITFSTVAIIGRLFFSRYIDNMNHKKLMSFSMICMTISLVWMLFLFNKNILLLIGFFHGIGHSMMYPVLNTCFLDLGDNGEKAILNNSYIVFYTIGGVVFSTSLGFIGDLFGTMSIFISMMTIIVMAFIYSSIFLKDQRFIEEAKIP